MKQGLFNFYSYRLKINISPIIFKSLKGISRAMRLEISNFERQLESIPDIENKKSEVGEVQDKLGEIEKENVILAEKEKDSKDRVTF